MAVVFQVADELHPLPEHAATILAEELRRKAAGQLGSEGDAGARELADAIETALVDPEKHPIRLEGDTAEAAYYVLDVSVTAPGDPAAALYRALREHRTRPGEA